MQSLRSLVADAESRSVLPPGDDERFTGYAVMSVPFDSGHVLGLRRFIVTSIGPSYTSVWHRDPSGNWTIYTTVDATLSCPRYFGSAISATSVHRIDITWTADFRFTVSIADALELTWNVSAAATPMTRLMSTAMTMVPEAGWHNASFLKAMGKAAGPSLRAGRMGLTGTTPNRQVFRAGPKKIWAVDDSTAVLNGTNLGRIRPLAEQTRLGDFWMPQRGIFMLGSATFEPFDPARHLAATTTA
ncbi:MAG: hypothetical protein JWP90_1469 [Mycetocola sp.]|nr:hypothetical protein [Mycetocola sp.]